MLPAVAVENHSPEFFSGGLMVLWCCSGESLLYPKELLPCAEVGAAF